MSTPNLKQWADALVDRPISLSDDWGNLLLSTGVAFQQKPQESGGLTSKLDCDTKDERLDLQDVSTDASAQASKVSALGLNAQHRSIYTAYANGRIEDYGRTGLR